MVGSDGVTTLGGQCVWRCPAVILVGGVLVLRSKGQHAGATSARLAELQSRIRPHFLFNTLNSAIALVRAEPARPKPCWRI
jgi:LytS/YehU family sensor histidine kinase